MWSKISSRAAPLLTILGRHHCRKPCMSVHLFLVHVADFPGQNSRYSQQNSLFTLLEAIHFWHSSWAMRLPVLTLSQGRGFLCCKISFCSQQFSQRKICIKAQKLHLAEQQLPHNSLQPLLNIRQELIQLDYGQLTMSVLLCDSHCCFRLSCLSKIAGLGLIEVAREHHMLSSQPIKTPADSFDMALTQ